MDIDKNLLEWLPKAEKLVRSEYRHCDHALIDDLVQIAHIAFIEALEDVDLSYTSKQVFNYCFQRSKWACLKTLATANNYQTGIWCDAFEHMQTEEAVQAETPSTPSLCDVLQEVSCIKAIEESLDSLPPSHKTMIIDALFSDNRRNVRVSSSQFSRVKLKFEKTMKMNLAS